MYLFFDVETGGLTTDTSLLSAYFLITNDNLETLGSIDLQTIPDDGIYHVNAGALEINKINLVEHSRQAVTYSNAGKLLVQFFQTYYQENRDKRFIPVGHNVGFDIAFVKQYLLTEIQWSTYCSRRFIDTSSVAQFLLSAGRLDSGVSGSLTSLLEALHIPPEAMGFDEAKSHTASYDTLATRAVFRKMLRMQLVY